MSFIKITSAFYLILVSLFSFSQSPFPGCGTDELLNSTLQQDSIFRQKHLQTEQDLYQEINYLIQNNIQLRSGGPYVLPVVVHVIHNNGVENISDAQVQAAIDHLNDAFANTGFYDPNEGVNTNIQFCLASQTPQGAASNGIVRVQSALTDLDMADDLQMKNLSRWNPLCYMNIWVVKEICNQNGCGVAGYAYFPSSHGGLRDGIVVEARYFGSTPGNSGVTVHEVGHYLGLYHTFQGGCTNNNCLSDGDRVCDTPPDQSTAAIACNGSMNSCTTDTQSGLSVDMPDNHRNYMDYGYPSCMNNYTQGQTDRMHWHIDNVRFSLLNCLSCNDPCTANVTALFSPSAINATVGTTVTFTNQSVNAATFNWYVNGQLFSTNISPTYNFNTQGTYIIRMQAIGSDPNCIGFYSDTIYVTCSITAGMTQSTTYINIGESVTFTNTSTGGTSFAWFVDGILQSTSSTTYTHTFNSGGTYPVFLIASGPLCSDTTSLVNFIHVGQPCAISFTKTPQQATTCLPVTFTPDTTCRYSNYFWTFCDPDTFGIPDIELYSITGTLPAGSTFIRDQQGNYFVFYALYNNSVTPNTIYRLDFGNSISNTPTVNPVNTPGITALNAHGVDVVYEGGNYYGFAIYYSSIYRIDFGLSLTNSNPTVTQLTGVSPNTLNWGHKIAIVRETNTWWLLAVARNSNSLNVYYLGSDITNQIQSSYAYTTCSSCSGFTYQKVNGNHYVYAGSLFSGIRLYSFGNSLANVPTVGSWHSIGTGYVGDLALYQNCDGSFDGVVLKENNTNHSIIRLDSISATPTIIINSFSNGLGRSGGSTRLYRTEEGLTMFAVQGYTNNVVKINFSECGIPYSTDMFPPPVYYPQAGNYYVRLAVDEGLPSQQVYCMSVNVAEITGNPLDLGPDITTCDNAAHTLDAGTGFSTYLWDDGSTDQLRTTFFPGTYWVETTDSCSATYRDSITISVNPATTIVLNDATICRGISVMLTAPAGFTNYVWTPATGLSCTNCASTIATPNDTTVYTVTATTADGCVNSGSATINVNDCGTNIPLTALLSSTTVSCAGENDGSVTVLVSGGVPPYTYTWSTGATTPTVSNLSLGSYTVTVSDSVGTTIISNVFINAPTPLFVITSSFTQRVTCYGDNTGAAKVAGSGGTAPYTYLWNNGNTNDSPTNLPAGVHSVTITDFNGCTATASITIQDGPLVNGGMISGPDTVDIHQPAQFFVNTGYNYQWQSNGSLLSGQGTNPATIDWNVEGVDTVWVIISNSGCADTLWKQVVLLNLTSIYDIALFDIEVFPNPNTGKLNVRSRNIYSETELRLFDALGKMILVRTVESIEIQTGVELDMRHTSEGIYLLHILTGNDVRVVKVVRN